MRKALALACKAAQKGEAPIGAVIVRQSDGRVLATGYNKREIKNDATSHAEIEAIRKAGKKIGDWRLSGCDMYVTLEPCLMCSGAIIQSRIERVFFGAFDPKTGAAGTLADIFKIYGLNHRVEVISGIMEQQCSQILSDFFRQLRK
jgi:tRNA(adenine34) deaminase